MGRRTKSLLLALCMSLPGATAGAQQTTKANANPVPPAFREMQQVEDRWATAVTKRDQYALELVLAPQYIGISASGDVTTRNQQIAHLFVKNAGPGLLGTEGDQRAFRGRRGHRQRHLRHELERREGPRSGEGHFLPCFRTPARQLALPEFPANRSRRGEQRGSIQGQAQSQAQRCRTPPPRSPCLQRTRQYPATPIAILLFCHEEQLTCLRQVKSEMNGERSNPFHPGVLVLCVRAWLLACRKPSLNRWALAPAMAHSAPTAGSGATAKKLNGKASLYEGHGFSRAVTITEDDGFSR